MSYSYKNQLNYGQQTGPMLYDGMTYKKPSAIPMAITGALVGGVGGAGIGAYKATKNDSFMSKNGDVNDSFAKETYERYINSAKNAGKESYQGSLNILNKIDNVKNPEELKELLDANKEAAENICKELNQKTDDYVKNITNENLAANKKIIKDKINAGNNTRYQDIKNKIQACWNKDKKTFVKNENVSEDLFKVIKKSSTKFNWKTMGKFAAIGAGITAFVGYIAGKILLR